MTDRVWRDGVWLRKRLSATDPEHGQRIVSRTRALTTQGVRTPQARYDKETRELVFPWIAGQSGRELLQQHFLLARAKRWDEVSATRLTRFLIPLAQLHKADPTTLDLSALNPWRLIDDRLQKLRADASCGEAAGLYDLARQTYQAGRENLIAVSATVPTRAVPVHGDYHVGQLLFSSAAAAPWLLDLDDVALGPPESDLGNFIAHLVSSEGLAAEGVMDGFLALQPRLCTLYRDLAGVSVDPRLINAYGAVALIRRALKLRQRGDETADLPGIFLAARDLAHRQR